MSSKSVRRPTPALIVAIVALVAALAGSAIALPGKNTVKSNDIAKNAVRSSDVKNDSLKGKDINESKLGKVPNAARADSSAATDVIKTAQGTLAGGQSATLLQHGPLALTAECGDADGDSNLDIVVYISSSTPGTVFSSWRDGSDDLGPGTPKTDRELNSASWAESTTTYNYDGPSDTNVSATAANGNGFNAYTGIAAEDDTNTCWYWMNATILG